LLDSRPQATGLILLESVTAEISSPSEKSFENWNISHTGFNSGPLYPGRVRRATRIQ
jgi:hypothetical protein